MILIKNIFNGISKKCFKEEICQFKIEETSKIG